MKGVILPEFGTVPAMSITPKKIDRYVKKRLTEKRIIKHGAKRQVIGPAKKTTVHRELSDIKAVLNWAVRRNIIAFNPIEKIRNAEKR